MQRAHETCHTHENDHIENMEFSIMHKPLYEEIEKWMNTDDTQDKPLWLQ